MLIDQTIADRIVDFSGRNDYVGTKRFPSEFFENDLAEFMVLYFYPGDFTSICATEVLAFNTEESIFRELGAVVVGCSVNNLIRIMLGSEDLKRKVDLARTSHIHSSRIYLVIYRKNLMFCFRTEMWQPEVCSSWIDPGRFSTNQGATRKLLETSMR